jgi:hypothetical protein
MPFELVVAAEEDSLGGENDHDDHGDDEEEEEEEEEELVEVAANEEDDGEEEDEEVVAAAIVMDDENDDEDMNSEVIGNNEDEDQEEEEGDEAAVEEVEAVVVEAEPSSSSTTPGQKRKQSSPTKQQKSPKKGSAKKSSSQQHDKKTLKKKKKSAGDSTTAKRTTSSSASTLDALYRSVPQQKIEAAVDARMMLQETVPTLPAPVADTLVRSFGRLYIQGFDTTSVHDKADSSHKIPLYHTTDALYPVGFSCDRHEFSPVHGRMLKMRCSILDGRRIKTMQRKAGHEISNIHDGPIFRIMWGMGIDQDDDENVTTKPIDYPFEPHTHSPPLFMTGNAKNDAALKEAVVNAIPVTAIIPQKGMRVKVKFAKNQYFNGTITKIVETKHQHSTHNVDVKKKKAPVAKVHVRYDDGSEEKFEYPDPDLSLLMPGTSIYVFCWFIGREGTIVDSHSFLQLKIQVRKEKLGRTGNLS